MPQISYLGIGGRVPINCVYLQSLGATVEGHVALGKIPRVKMRITQYIRKKKVSTQQVTSGQGPANPEHHILTNK